MAEQSRDARSRAMLLESTGEGIYGIDRTDQVPGRNRHRQVNHTLADGGVYPEHQCPILNAYRFGEPCRNDHACLTVLCL